MSMPRPLPRFATPRPVVAALLLALTCAGGPAFAQKPLPANTIDIWDDSGGNVLQMLERRKQLQASGKEVRIRGYCRSACTMLITMPNACLGPKARIGFHAPRIPNTAIIPPMVDQIMGDTYRGGIRDRWFGGWNRSLDMTVITAADYVRLDPQTRICASLSPRR